MIETKCSTCGFLDRFCTNLCGWGSGHSHANGGAGLARQLDYQSNKKLITQIREEVLDIHGISLMNEGYFLKGDDVLALLDAIEKELK